MKTHTATTFAVTTAAFGALAAGALGLAGAASAAPTGGAGAADVVHQLQAEGYSVQINGDKTAPLSSCTVTDVSGLSGTNSAGEAIVPTGSTVYVTVACNDSQDD